jgi:hypothetical protein
MKLRYAILPILLLVLFTSCNSNTLLQEDPLVVESKQKYEYVVGLGYGFLGKAVQVTINSRKVIFMVGTNEIEQYAQMQGTKMLASGSTSEKEIIVQVIVDGGEPYEQVIDLSTGMYVHIYLERTGLRVYNTQFLVLE